MFVKSVFGFLFTIILSTIFLPAQVSIPERGEIFRDDVIARIDISLSPDSLSALYAPGNEWSNYHYQATFQFDNGTQVDIIENIGFRFRGNTSRTSEKKSFKISFNTYQVGRKYGGLEKMNLNGEHNDPTVTRSKLCWDMLREFGIQSPRSNHVQLYINGDYYGLYVNVEHIDEEYVELRFGNKNGNLYKCLWPADLDYKGDNPDLYKEVHGDRRVYDLRTNIVEDDYSDLAHFIDVLNNTPTASMACELEKVFNVDDYLKYLVVDISTGNWDGPIYNQNNFYLYHNTATDKMEYIPYDLDNTLGIDWLNRNWGTRNIYDWAQHNQDRPLYWSIMNVPEYRDRFSYYMNQFQDAIFNENHLFPRIEELKSQINIPALIDPFRPLDYEFTYQNFIHSFDESLDYFHTPYGLKPYITTRHNVTTNQLELNNIPPIIRQLIDNQPSQGQDIAITAQIENDDELATTQFCYSINNEGVTNCVPIYDDGLHNDQNPNDGVFGAIIPAIDGASSIHYYINAVDETGLSSRKPRCNRQEIVLHGGLLDLYINEIMASNDNTIADEQGEFDDWLELYNHGDEAIYLGDKFLSDDIAVPNKWSMPNIFIMPGEYLLFWADNDEEQGEMHTNFKLSASGEFIGIFDSETNNFDLIDGLDFGEQQTDVAYGRIPDGVGVFQEVVPTPAAMNEPITAIQNLGDEKNINIYPNPFLGYLMIEYPDINGQNWTAKLIDPLGRQLLQQRLNTGLNLMNFDEILLVKGVYVLQIIDSTQQVRMAKVLIY